VGLSGVRGGDKGVVTVAEVFAEPVLMEVELAGARFRRFDGPSPWTSVMLAMAEGTDRSGWLESERTMRDRGRVSEVYAYVCEYVRACVFAYAVC